MLLPITRGPNRSKSWNNKGNALIELKRYEERLAACERALTTDPNYAVAWNNKAGALGDLGQRADELVACEKALALDPNDPSPGTTKARRSVLQRYEEALVAYEREAALDPEYVKCWWGKGAMLHRLHRYQEALAAYDQALALRAPGREVEAQEAERRAQALGA
jgi:tetratricopeptide (TPR) repeat protein